MLQQTASTCPPAGTLQLRSLLRLQQVPQKLPSQALSLHIKHVTGCEQPEVEHGTFLNGI